MDYVFGYDLNEDEVLKTVGAVHTELIGNQQIVREYPGETITDSFRVLRKTHTLDDSGLCYDWYQIDRHYRQIDRTPGVNDKIEHLSANQDYMSMMSGIDLPTEERMEVNPNEAL